MECLLCPNACRVNKNLNKGACGTDNNIRIAKYYLHPFEEPIISGTNGSGTIFFCGCSLKCLFCQNFELSRNLRGKTITLQELVSIIKQLEEMGAHNINFVSPTHYSDKIIEALDIYKPNIPIVYNTHGYERVEILKNIDKYVDIYLPDIKFFSPKMSLRYTNKSDYFEVAKKAIEFMVQKPLIFSNDGLLKSGVVVRHLVLPQGTSESKKILDWFKDFKDCAYLNIMSQYTPFGDIKDCPELNRKITAREYESVVDYAISLGISNMFYQKQQSASEEYIPKWDY